MSSRRIDQQSKTHVKSLLHRLNQKQSFDQEISRIIRSYGHGSDDETGGAGAGRPVRLPCSTGGSGGARVLRGAEPVPGGDGPAGRDLRGPEGGTHKADLFPRHARPLQLRLLRILRCHQHQIKTKSGSGCWLHDAFHARSLLPLPFNGLPMA
ncbi:hypothetical protein QJS04_geneDACA015386 [Acorus gramineus]|uniref:Uncharacterized protein n=1 Tax=Acorus gramineus TaxID=55184 RepID=A0AAV9A5Z2_ACOGR|nr:hypothetical protein QJS04_geneDACA015386 [Acorus gramineus]